jgi:hypothetical protein
VVAADDRPLAHAEHGDRRVPLRERGRVHVVVIAFVGVDVLPLEGAVHRLQLIPQRGRALVIELFRGALHLRARLA